MTKNIYSVKSSGKAPCGTDIHTVRQAEKYLGRKEWRKMS